MPRVRDAHWHPGGEWPRPICPGPEGKEPACGAPVDYYKPPGRLDPVEYEMTPEDNVMLQPCGHIVPAKAVGVALFTSPLEDPDDHERVEDAAQLYLKEFG